MADENDSDLGNEHVAETETNSSLDDLINQALDKTEAPEIDTDEPARADNRDEKGRFASKAEGNESPEAIQPTPAADDTPVLAEQHVELPARWTEAEKAAVAGLPREAQELLTGKYKQMEADYTRKTQEVAEFRRNAEPLLNAVQPYSNYLAQVGQNLGVQPGQLIQNLLGAEYTLRTGTPQEKAMALAKIAAEYGIAPQPMGTAQNAEQPSAPQPDPYVNHLYQQMPVIGQELNQLRQFQQEFEAERISRQVAEFQNAKDASGNLLHPYFEDVRPHMSALLQTGQADTMERAYAMATEPFQKVMQSQQAARQQADEKAKAEALEKARRAAPVRASGSSPKGQTQAKGLDAILGSTLDRAGFA